MTYPAGMDVRLGPLAFVHPIDNISEAVGDGLDVLGASLVAAERKPRGVKLKLPVRAKDGSTTPKEDGDRLRRQLRQLLNNAAWRLQGFYFTWAVDPDMDCWLKLAAGELAETDPGISFGEYQLELDAVYLVGRPGTHRPGRRAQIADYRTGLVPRDTRRQLYSQFMAEQESTEQPLFLPGDVSGIVASGGIGVESTPGLERSGRLLYTRVAAQDGQVFDYIPDPSRLSERSKYLDLDDLGAIRVWNFTGHTVAPGSYTAGGDADPTAYGWERVYGTLLSGQEQLAMDNGLCRVVWLGGSAGQLAIEYFDSTTYLRLGRVAGLADSVGHWEAKVISVTPERAVLEWREGPQSMRCILQRGWPGPRLESYSDGGEAAYLEWHPEGSGVIEMTEPGPKPMMRQLKRGTGKALLWAKGTEDETVSSTPIILPGETPGVSFHRLRVIVAQLGLPVTGMKASETNSQAIASLSLADVRPIPVLVGRR